MPSLDCCSITTVKKASLMSPVVNLLEPLQSSMILLMFGSG